MKLIKSTITALGLLFTVTACAGNKESKNQNMKGENMEIVHLTKAEFLKKVYNYEANPNDWKYEGDKPAIVLCYMVRPLQGIGTRIGRVGKRICRKGLYL